MMPPSTSEPPRPPARGTRLLWLALGWLFVAIGFMGALLPLLPTTIFLILAAGCFARSSPRLEAWLLTHPQFGPSLRNWRESGAIAPWAKFMACAGMVFGYAIFWWTVRPSITVDLGVGMALAACAAFVLSRPSAR